MKSGGAGGVFFFRRARTNMDATPVAEPVVLPAGSVRFGRRIALAGKRPREMAMKPLRLVGYTCPETGRDYVFLTNIEHLGTNHRRPLQGVLAGRAVLQMAEAEPQAQGLPRHLEKRRPHPDLGGALRQPAPRLSEVRLARRSIDATDCAIAPAQLVPAPRSLGAAQERSAAAAITARAMGASPMIRLTDPLWDSSESDPD